MGFPAIAPPADLSAPPNKRRDSAVKVKKDEWSREVKKKTSGRAKKIVVSNMRIYISWTAINREVYDTYCESL